jgi:hypothetical protein
MIAGLTFDLENGKSWARRFEEMASEAERMCARMADLIALAEEEGEFTPERRERLAAAWRNAPRWLSVETERPKQIPAPAFSMPILDE